MTTARIEEMRAAWNYCPGLIELPIGMLLSVPLAGMPDRPLWLVPFIGAFFFIGFDLCAIVPCVPEFFIPASDVLPMPLVDDELPVIWAEATVAKASNAVPAHAILTINHLPKAARA